MGFGPLSAFIRKVIGSDNYAKLRETFVGILIGSNEHRIYQGGTGVFNIATGVSGSQINLMDELGNVKFQFNDPNDEIRSLIDLGVRSGMELKLYNAGNTAFGRIRDNSGAIEIANEGLSVQINIPASGNQTQTRNLLPQADSTYVNGTDSSRWSALYADQVYTDVETITDNNGNSTANPADFVIMTGLTGNKTFTLQTADVVKGRTITIKAGTLGGNIITIDTQGAEQIDGAPTQTITSNYESITVKCDGTNWFVK